MMEPVDHLDHLYVTIANRGHFLEINFIEMFYLLFHAMPLSLSRDPKDYL